MPTNALFILIDSLRHDTLADMDAARVLFPNLARLAERGFVRKVVTNAQSTQFVLPSLFSLTYPLDHGGYNQGIRNRPKSYVEVLREAGFHTNLFGSCNGTDSSQGYDRGFDHSENAFDFRHILEYRITKTLSYDIDLWRKGERTKEETLAIIKTELTALLDAIEGEIRAHGNAIWSSRLRRINMAVANRCPAERALLESQPEAVLAKLRSIPPRHYWRFLGQPAAGRALLFWARAREAVLWRTRRLALRINLPFMLLTNYRTLASEVATGFERFLAGAKAPWFVYFHMMDVHDCRALNRPLSLFARLRFLPRWLKARRRGLTKRRVLYDLALMYSDAQVGRMMAALERRGFADDTLVLVTGDHGFHYADSPRPKPAVGLRTHYEDIETPLLLAGSGRQPSDAGLIDSMGVTATFLDALGIQPDPSFKGRSAFGAGREAVISESAGSGNADLSRRDIYFTVTTPSHRMMTVLKGSEIEVAALYDRIRDPSELENIASAEGAAEIVADLLGLLYAERAELLAQRCYLPPSGARSEGGAGRDAA